MRTRSQAVSLAALALAGFVVLALPERAEPTPPPQREPSAVEAASQASLEAASQASVEAASQASVEAAATPDPAAAALAVVDVEECAACHEDQVTKPHHAGGSVSCGSCHAGAAAHAEAGGDPELVFGFGDDGTAQTKSEACLTCHWTEQPRFFTGSHAAVGADCSTCHSIHWPADDSRGALLQAAHGVDRPMENLSASTALCQGCHGEVMAEFELNERHRLREGVLDCVSCHDPHASESRAPLGGFKQQQCVECHADKGGPFVFEHPVQQADGCTACHEPHGSQNRHMLKVQRNAELCFTCHVALPGFHSRFTADTVCTNCHATIHGSNFDPAFLK